MKTALATVYFVGGDGWVDNVEVIEVESEGLIDYVLDGYKIDKVISPTLTLVAHPND